MTVRLHAVTVRGTSSAILVIIAALAWTACARPALTKSLDADADELTYLLEEIDRQCRFLPLESTAAITAAVSVHGSSYGRPLRGRVWVGADPRHRSLRIESADTVPPQFVVVSQRALLARDDVSDGDATLLLPRQQLIVQRENSRQVLTAVLGLPLSAQEFVWAFTGCQTAGGALEMTTLDAHVTKVSIGAVPPFDLFMERRRPSGRTLVAMSRAVDGREFRWRAEYRRQENGTLRSVRIVSQEANGRTGRFFDLHLSLSRTQIAPLVGPATFSLEAPTSRAVSLEDVQRQRSNRSLPLLSEGGFGR